MAIPILNFYIDKLCYDFDRKCSYYKNDFQTRWMYILATVIGGAVENTGIALYVRVEQVGRRRGWRRSSG